MDRRATVIRRRLQAPVMVLESGHGDGGEVNRARQRGLLGFRRVPGCMQRLKALMSLGSKMVTAHTGLPMNWERGARMTTPECHRQGRGREDETVIKTCTCAGRTVTGTCTCVGGMSWSLWGLHCRGGRASGCRGLLRDFVMFNISLQADMR